ncbi:hypothetical protein DP142_25590, partial [Salmonella enterica subsp. enterica serovar Typhimurium]
QLRATSVSESRQSHFSLKISRNLRTASLRIGMLAVLSVERTALDAVRVGASWQRLATMPTCALNPPDGPKSGAGFTEMLRRIGRNGAPDSPKRPAGFAEMGCRLRPKLPAGFSRNQVPVWAELRS